MRLLNRHGQGQFQLKANLKCFKNPCATLLKTSRWTSLRQKHVFPSLILHLQETVKGSGGGGGFL